MNENGQAPAEYTEREKAMRVTMLRALEQVSDTREKLSHIYFLLGLELKNMKNVERALAFNED